MASKPGSLCYDGYMSNDDINYFSVLLEEIKSQNKAVLEYVGEMPKVVTKLAKIEEAVQTLQQDVKIVKATVIDLSHQVHDQEHRISRLEAA